MTKAVFLSASNLAHISDGHHLVPEPVSPTADGRHDTRAYSSTTVVVQQDTDGAHVENTRPIHRKSILHSIRAIRRLHL